MAIENLSKKTLEELKDMLACGFTGDDYLAIMKEYNARKRAMSSYGRYG